MIPKSAANFSAICLVMQSKYKQNSVRVCVRMVCMVSELAWVRGVAQGWIGRAGQRRAEEGWARQTELVLRSTGREIHTRKLDGICTHIRMPRSVAHVPVRQNKHEPCQSQPSDVSGGGASLLYVWSQREFCPKITAYMGTGVRGVRCGVCVYWGEEALGWV